MQRFGLVVASLILGTAFHVCSVFVGFLLLPKAPGAEPFVISAAFFVCGMVLRLTKGFQYPRILVPVTALLAVTIVLANAYLRGLALTPDDYLSFVAIIFAYAGCQVPNFVSRS